MIGQLVINEEKFWKIDISQKRFTYNPMLNTMLKQIFIICWNIRILCVLIF